MPQLTVRVLEKYWQNGPPVYLSKILAQVYRSNEPITDTLKIKCSEVGYVKIMKSKDTFQLLHPEIISAVD